MNLPPPVPEAWRAFVERDLRAARAYLELPKDGRGPRWSSRGRWLPEPDDDVLTND